VLSLQPQGLLGHLLFAERITLRWALGIVLVISGLLLISASVISTAPAPAQQPQHPQAPSSSKKQGQVAAKKLS
jgi:drug/metabolite transporter (DMT)-like permease